MKTIKMKYDVRELDKVRLLHSVYEKFQIWIDGIPVACKKGCSSCCTQSVMLTSLEAEIILDYLKRENKIELLKIISSSPYSRNIPPLTTNRFAGLCLDKQEPPANDGDWNFSPCIFLSRNVCQIYDARPFVCRCFLSMTPCHINGEAHTPQWIITLNTVIMQIIEHIDTGGKWGAMTDVLKWLLSGESAPCLADTEPLPGLLLHPEEKSRISNMIQSLSETRIDDKAFSDCLGVNFSDCFR